MFKEMRYIFSIIFIVMILFSAILFIGSILCDYGAKGLWTYVNSPTAYYLKYDNK